jgi:hypothetical protein
VESLPKVAPPETPVRDALRVKSCTTPPIASVP